MLHSANVLYPNDLKNGSQNPTGKFKSKRPIIAITLRFRSPGILVLTVMRHSKAPRTYTPNPKIIKHLTLILKNLVTNDRAVLSPDTWGWTAYIDSISPPQAKPTGPTEVEASEHINFLDRRIPVLGTIGPGHKITWNGNRK